MIPVQDAVPSGRTPIATLALIAVNALVVVAGIDIGGPAAAAFTHTTRFTFLTSMWFLWLFGDHVEARLGRITLVLVYIAGVYLGAVLPSQVDLARGSPGLGVASGVSAVIGAYFVLMPRSRVLMLVPAPPSLAEVPAVFFLGFWWVLQTLTFVVTPMSRLQGSGGAGAVYTLAAAMLMGAVGCRVMRRPVKWR